MKAFRLFVLTVFILTTSVFSQTSTVENINKSPRTYVGDNVTVKGLVTIYRTGAGNTSYYMLRGDFGAILKVNTAEGSPELNQFYTVEGIVYVDETNGTPFISEKTRTKEGATNKKTTDMPGVDKPEPVTEPSFLNNTLIYILVGALVILVAAYFILRRRKSAEPVSAYTPPAYNPSVADYSASTVKLSPNDMQQQSSDDFKTIKITTASPKTLKFIPGKLTIVSGDDTGKSFKIAGYPTSEGSVVSIGREEVHGDRSYSHIQLMQKTISRKQAEIVQKDGKLFVKNLSDTNFTQLDGIEIKHNEKAELKTGAVLRLGELEVKYEV